MSAPTFWGKIQTNTANVVCWISPESGIKVNEKKYCLLVQRKQIRQLSADGRLLH